MYYTWHCCRSLEIVIALRVLQLLLCCGGTPSKIDVFCCSRWFAAYVYRVTSPACFVACMCLLIRISRIKQLRGFFWYLVVKNQIMLMFWMPNLGLRLPPL